MSHRDGKEAGHERFEPPLDSETTTARPHLSRRTMLRVVGAGSLAGLAGCIGQDDGDGGDGDDGDGGDGTGGTPTPTATSTPEPQMRTVTDNVGRTVEVPREVERVIAIGPGCLKKVVYLGAADRVVGGEEGEQRSTGQAALRQTPYNMANPQFQDLPIIGPSGSAAGGNAELIVQVGADVIFFVGDPARADELTAQTGIPVLVLPRVRDIHTEELLQAVYANWRLVGDVLNNQERAEELVDYYGGLLENLRTRTADIPAAERVSAYIAAIQISGPKGIGSTRVPFPPLDLAGVNHVAAEVADESGHKQFNVQLSREKLLDWNPETIFTTGEGVDDVLRAVQEYSELRTIDAIANDNVYIMLPHVQYNFNPESVPANAYFIGKTLYPERFADVSVEAKTKEIYQTFFNADESVYRRQKELFNIFERLEIPD